ncbi:MAG: hypothetical protein ACK5RO_00105 [Pseudobdellovibrionaceae bacterium]
MAKKVIVFFVGSFICAAAWGQDCSRLMPGLEKKLCEDKSLSQSYSDLQKSESEHLSQLKAGSQKIHHKDQYYFRQQLEQCLTSGPSWTADDCLKEKIQKRKERLQTSPSTSTTTVVSTTTSFPEPLPLDSEE